MADVHNIATRSYNMSRVKSKNTKPEILVRKFLFSKGYRYRLHDKRLSGKPDIILAKHRTVIFVHGCFWHGHKNCKFYVVPKTRTKFWLEKIRKNRKRDTENAINLKRLGWNVLSVFECELKGTKQKFTLNKILSLIERHENIKLY